ncbi:MAG: NAD-dependent DNA ligase LigA [Eubacteriales bacterium]|nr:NAD-dependent DNA ligase LigA [Eubacteriales bacterium]MDD4390728.1 NAD-dependent DNA ligase LigA [Eubacteriales bacterium]
MSRIKELVAILRKADKAYYTENREIISNLEYDALYDELKRLEDETGIVLSNSPTLKVGYEIMTALPKEAHEMKMLSLDKTKDPDTLASWLGDKRGLLSWKLDGLTISLTYEGGNLIKAITRGNGEIGEVVTANAKTFINLPLLIPHKGKIVLRGEAVISYADFKIINETIDNADMKYKNPRNLCSGSVRQLNSGITAQRHVQFHAFTLQSAESLDFKGSRKQQLEQLVSWGFDIAAYKEVTQETIRLAVDEFEDDITSFGLPSDGLVLTYDDINYGQSLGKTMKFPRDSIAFKWKDEIKETTLKEIEWSASRTGLINPIAVFDPVELEGTTVSRASVHNISIAKELALGIGDTITVYKANMIIPQIADNITRTGNLNIPETCPVCDKEAILRAENDIETLYCPNPECLAKHIKSLTLFVSRDGMNIEGLSEATIEKMIAKGIIKEYADIFKMKDHRDTIVQMEGFGEKSFDRLMNSIKKSRKTNVIRLLYSLGIPGIGVANSRLIAVACGGEWDRIKNISREDLLQIDGIGEIMADNYREFFDNPEKRLMLADIIKEIEFEPIELPNKTGASRLQGKVFVITGSLNHFENRKQLEELIYKNGGKSAGSVSAKTSYLINNDNASSSSKNKKAKELGVPIITENEFIEMLK